MERETFEKLLTTSELAALLRCSVRSIGRRVALGELPYYRLMGKPMFRLPEVEDWLKTRRFVPRRRRVSVEASGNRMRGGEHDV